MRFNQVEFGRRLKALRKERGMTCLLYTSIGEQV